MAKSSDQPLVPNVSGVAPARAAVRHGRNAGLPSLIMNNLNPSRFDGADTSGGNSKRQMYQDFGWLTSRFVKPKTLIDMYERNPIARAVVERPLSAIWEDVPVLRRGGSDERPDADALTPEETALRDHLDGVEFWAKLREAFVYSRITGYAFLVLHFSDGQLLQAPVGAGGETSASGSVGFLRGATPVWSTDMTVKTWGTDIADYDTYGRPVMYTYQQQRADGNGVGNAVDIHHSRVLIVSRDGSMKCNSPLLPVLNAVSDIDMLRGSAAAAAWYSSRGALVLNIGGDTDLKWIQGEAVDASAGEGTQDTRDGETALEKAVDDLFGKREPIMVVQDTQVTTLKAEVADPKNANDIAIGHVSAATEIPRHVLEGNNIGEAGGREDARGWARTCESIKTYTVRPRIREFMRLALPRMGLAESADATSEWAIDWYDLTSDTLDDQVKRADALGKLVVRFWQAGHQVLMDPNEGRDSIGLPEMTDEELAALAERVDLQMEDVQPTLDPGADPPQQDPQGGAGGAGAQNGAQNGGGPGSPGAGPDA